MPAPRRRPARVPPPEAPPRDSAVEALRLNAAQYRGSTRAAMEHGAPIVLAMLHDSLNKTADAAQKAAAEGKASLEGDLRDIFHRSGFRYLEITLGKKMSVNVNLRTQDDLLNLRAMPPAVRAELDRALDALDAFNAARTIDAPARELTE